jgi:uncharacterized protein YecT (DUF1311 family)
MRHSIRLIAATVSLAASPAQAFDCDNAVSTYELQACANEALAVSDAKLTAAYQQALASIKTRGGQPAPYDTKSYEEALRAAQRAWVTFRDAECKGVIPFAWTGGSGTGGAVLSCLISKTEARTKDLNEAFAPQ